MASVYLDLPLRSVGSISAPGLASETTLQALLTELQLKSDLSETQPVANTAALRIKKNGVITEVIKDTVVPSNTTPVPVEVVSASGTEINITTGDVHMQTSAEGSNFDSMRTGDGSGRYAGITINSEIKSHDADAITELTAIKNKINSSQVGTFDEDLSVSTTPETFTAPAGAFACFVEADDTNTTNIRVKMGGVASTTSGIQFQGGRSEYYQGGSNISYCAESGTGKISVQWFTR